MMRILWLIVLLSLVGCSAKKKPVAASQPPTPPAVAPAPAPIRSQMPPPTAEVIEHCVITKQENANTVSCRCEPVTTRIDSKTGHTVIVCKKMPQTK
jgi:hypothetical protein